MEKDLKDILLKDLCSRLPYDVKISIPDLWTSEKRIEVLNEIFKGDDGLYRVNDSGMLIEYIKPYLFPLSSMTEEQKRELNKLSEKECKIIENVVNNPTSSNVGFPVVVHYMIDWCNKNHFDYHGLIPMGLAIDATGLNIY